MAEGMTFQNPEEEIRYLEQKILEKKKELAEHDTREVARDAVREHVASLPSSQGVSDAPAAPVQAATDADNQVNYFVQMAFQSGISEAVAAARKIHNPHLLDALHDALADRFVDALRAKGLLE